MMNGRKSLELKILNNTFTVVTDGNEEDLQKIADFVNVELNAILEKSPNTNAIRIALLGCMNIAEKLSDAYKVIEAMKLDQNDNDQKIRELSQELNNAKDEIGTLNYTIEQKENEKIVALETIEKKNDLLNQFRERIKVTKHETESNRQSFLELQNRFFESQLELSKVKNTSEEKNN